MLKTRIISAIIAAPCLVIFVIFTPSFIFSVFVFLASFFCFQEYFNLIFTKEKFNCKIIGITCGLILSFNVIFKFYDLLPILTFFIILLFFCYLFLNLETDYALKSYALTLLGILYIGILLPYLSFIREEENGEFLLLIMLGMVWASDTGAYFIGKKFGKYKLHYKISPGKTIEGFFGGITASILFSMIAKLVIFDALGFFDYIVLAILIGVIGPLGDLSESLIKRAVGTKDSGTLIPGHGGILDRIDAVLFAAPVFYYYIKMLNIL